ncbi:MAG: flagellar basal body L-ring protein FlgH [bacterium]
MEKVKKIITVNCMIGIFIFVFTSAALATSIWQDPDSERSMYKDEVAVTEGDILLIVVSESSMAQTDSNREKDKEVSMGGSAGQDNDDSTFFNDLVSWIPIFGASLSGSSSSASERNSDMTETLNTRMSVVVDEVSPSGVLSLRGTREIKVEDEIKTMKFKGNARKKDVRTDNTIPSDRIANAEISYESGIGQRKGKPRGLIGRSFVFIKNVLFW